ncbi:HD domain-containing protein [Streptomyces californicus]
MTGTAKLSVSEAEAVAREAHARQTDKAGRPYVEHLAAVAEGVRVRGGDDGQIAAAWLHDAIEDGALTAAWLADAALPQRVKDMVLAVTKWPGEALTSYTARILATPGVLLVKEADLAHNADPARLARRWTRPTRTRLAGEVRPQVRGLLGLPGGGPAL